MIRRYSAQESHLDLSLGIQCGPHHFVEPGFELHTHEFVEMVVVLGGRGVHLTGYGDYEIGAGDIFVIHRDIAHGFAESRGMDIVNFMLTQSFLDDTGRWLRQLPGYHSLFVLEPAYRYRQKIRNRLRLSAAELKPVARLVESISEELANERPAYRAMVTAHWQMLFAHLCRVFSNVADGDTPFSPLADTIAFMERHYPEKLSLRDLARRACLSPNHFIRMFRLHYGMTPGKYLSELRIERAKELLRGTERSVTDIAFSCGFSDSNYFARAFREAESLTPRAYRQRWDD
jgi:AraC family L-rhamnose operon transcriptional activator RhaR/AraC family L-rhamnose operon regulatory protein RhaS